MKGFSQVLLIALIIGFCSPVYAWGSDGHQMVAQVANGYLTNTTLNQIAKQLNGYTLANISTWPDNYDHSSAGEWSSQLHFVNNPTTALNFSYDSCIPPYAEPYGCVIAAITNFTHVLQTNYDNDYYEKCTDTSDSDEPCPLSFVTHFLGDSHQPLHVAYEIDEGGNYVDVEYDNSCTNLHSVWDSRLLYTYEDDNDLDWYGVAMQMLDWLAEEPQAVSVFVGQTNPADWGSETFAIARFAPYNTSPATVPSASQWVISAFNYMETHNMTTLERSNYKVSTQASSSDCGIVLGYSYYQKSIPVVFTQLAKAGTRLAYLLNNLYDPSFNGVLVPNHLFN
mmetsp:Transcript_124/g.153  ORF Transcript_124/g.153 Transcript_124/m.153 type:complete len:338 (+) Transcript_124:29-1042(+)